MLMMTPYVFMLCSTVYFDSKKVPTVSIIKTVRKALGDSVEIGLKKLPAAPLTKTSICPCFCITSLTVF